MVLKLIVTGGCEVYFHLVSLEEKLLIFNAHLEPYAYIQKAILLSSVGKLT